MMELQTIRSVVTSHPSGDARFASLDDTIAHYKAEPTALIQVLHAAQQLFGYLSPDVLRYIAGKLKLPLAQVYGVVTFYHLFTLVPRGKYQIMVCRGTACHVRGAQLILERLSQQLGIKEGETTKDNLFSLHSARCIGACAMAPAIAIGDDVYGKLTPDKVPKFCQKDLKKYT
ncbi:MAG: NAD(P)H-dependent oxidoreductase subunit E [Verrucomicrobiae bacterium]|nr:NAD(P)H-dependent oxidoreductase subunit E [Verrucomicrobiae bacterium]MCX7915263.1 NAD(P)H-dependent oxidoreductase subunit E [Verrucomicrobiae bacterium]MDW8342924.1 NAD(P)H-dependent oxidoreductase subunit E [Verrucomicrobiae bacterium]